MPGVQELWLHLLVSTVYKRLTERGCRELLRKLASCEVADANEPEDSCLLAEGV
jgi:hypothetical protein